MLRLIFDDNSGNRWERVNATRARNAFMGGIDVTLVPCRLRPFGPWNPQFTVNLRDSSHEWELQRYGAETVWNTLVNSATAYNCSHETGYYLAFYVPASTI